MEGREGRPTSKGRGGKEGRRGRGGGREGKGMAGREGDSGGEGRGRVPVFFLADLATLPTSLRCDEEVARISAAAMSPPRPRTSSAPDSPSRRYTNMPVGESQHHTPPPAIGVWSHAPSHMSSRAQSRAPSQMSGLDVAGLLNRLVDRQHDDLQQAVQQAKAEAAKREKQLKAEV